MTREEQINDASETYMNGLFEDGVEIPNEDYENIFDAFCQGAEWADKYPKSPWISVKDDLPCNHEELLNAKYQTKEIFISKYGGFPDVDYMLNTGGKWMWFKYKNPEFWMPVPELPKEYGLNYEKRNR